MCWLMSDAGPLGSVANVGNQWIGQLGETAVVGKCTHGWWSCIGPASCTACIRRSARLWQRAKSHRIVRTHHRPRHPQEDNSSRGSIGPPDCDPSKPASLHQGGGTDLGYDRMEFREGSNRSSSACDRTWDFAYWRKADSRG